MSEFKLYVGNRVYSSWSIRGYMVMKYSGVDFSMVDISLDQDGYGTHQIKDVLAVSPSGCVPLLQHGDLSVWDSLAIAEYMNEITPNANLYPQDFKARAIARALTCEMHSGFMAVRNNLTHNLKRRVKEQNWDDATKVEIARFDEIFSKTRRQFGGKFMFGDKPNIVDAFYMPIASRFRTYSVTISPDAQQYCQNLLAQDCWLEWEKDALENWKPFSKSKEFDHVYED